MFGMIRSSGKALNQVDKQTQFFKYFGSGVELLSRASDGCPAMREPMMSLKSQLLKKMWG
jgi:hypothetical protein